MNKGKRYFECGGNEGHRWHTEGMVPNGIFYCPECKAEGYEVAPPVVEDFKYEIILEDQNPLLSTIEKTGKKIRFTLMDIKIYIDECAKVIKETEGQLLIEESKVKNIEDHHSYVKELTPEQLFTIHLYQTELAKVTLLKEKISNHQIAIKEYEAEEEKVKSQIGVAVPKKSLDSKVIDLGSKDK